MAHRLLRLTKRSYQRPCGAGTSTGRMDKSSRLNWWMGGMEKGRFARGTENRRRGGDLKKDLRHTPVVWVWATFLTRRGGWSYRTERGSAGCEKLLSAQIVNRIPIPKVV